MEEASIGETEENLREHREYSRRTRDITGLRTNAAQLFPLIKPVVDQYKHKIPDHYLKRFAKEVRLPILTFRSTSDEM